MSAPSPLKTISQPVAIAGELTVTAGGGIGTGNIRTRPAGVNTGGGDVVARHVYVGGSAGGIHILNSTAGNDFSIQPDGSPATNIVINSSLDSVVVGSINIATGVFTITSLVAAIDGAMTFTDGRPNSSAILPVNLETRSICGEDFTPLGWRMVTDVGGAFRVQVLRQAYSSYDNSTWVDVTGTTVSPSGMPAIASGLKATASNITGWSSTADWSRGDVIRAIINNNGAAAGWYSLQIYGRRNVKKT